MSHFTSESGQDKHDLFAFEDQPPPLDTDFNFQQKPIKTDDVAGDFHKFDMKPSPTKSSPKKDADLLGDFLVHERQAPLPVPTHPREAPPAIPTFEAFEVEAEINTNNEEKETKVEEAVHDAEEDFGQIQPDYLNPYASAGKLESNEKFISTDDLIGLSDNEGKADKEHAFEDCNKDEEDEVAPPQVAKVEETFKHAPIPEPVKEAAKAASVPVSQVVEPTPAPKALPPQKNPEKPVQLLEAEKIFMRCGLGKLNFIFLTIHGSTTHFCARSQKNIIFSFDVYVASNNGIF